jgi:hypothetical protein
MGRKKHPLSENQSWRFNQPEIKIESFYTAVNRKTGRKTALRVGGSDTCRETTICNVRNTFTGHLTNHRELAGIAYDERVKLARITRDGDLESKVDLTILSCHWHQNWMKGWEDFPVEKFIRVCDIILGTTSILLSPWRRRGDWWKTNPDTALLGDPIDSRWVSWQGSDNWPLAHPATMAIALGLFRQCFHLCGAGVADQIIEAVSEDETTEVMSNNSQKLALRLINRVKPWIEVPVGSGGFRVNYAFPLGTWGRLIKLQRAIRRHGYEKALGQDFHTGWGLPSSSPYDGLHTFWGGEEDDNLTEHHHHLMRVGAPRRATHAKSAEKIT